MTKNKNWSDALECESGNLTERTVLHYIGFCADMVMIGKSNKATGLIRRDGRVFSVTVEVNEWPRKLVERVAKTAVDEQGV